MQNIKSLLTGICIICLSATHAQVKSVDNFDHIKASGSLDITLVNSPENKLDIDMITGDIKNLKAEVKGNQLFLKIDNKWGFGNKTKAKITVYHDGISGVDASAGSKVTSKDLIKSDKMNISASSGARCDLTIESNELEVDVSSGASARLQGSSKKQEAEASSGASYDGLALETEETHVDVSSGASAKVWSKSEIHAEASSGGSVKYKGDPTETHIDAGKYSGGSIKKI